MSDLVFAVVMVAGMLGMAVLVLPSVLWKTCPRCGTKNTVDTELCKECRQPFPDDE